ncbi:hypothetical protein [Streptomyces sp. NPDC060194]|uniref:hypothetical protein n=1 Tax=Streptomyces sp. NPDC060194 TaxID=3347069 RepID=UPI00364E327A
MDSAPDGGEMLGSVPSPSKTFAAVGLWSALACCLLLVVIGFVGLAMGLGTPMIWVVVAGSILAVGTGLAIKFKN